MDVLLVPQTVSLRNTRHKLTVCATILPKTTVKRFSNYGNLVTLHSVLQWFSVAFNLLQVFKGF